jgi:hypothetical protein
MSENNIITKQCSICKEIKNNIDFRGHKLGKNGTRSNCKICELKYKKQYREKNKEKISISYKNWAQNNSEKKNAINTKWFDLKKENDFTFVLTQQIRSLINISIRSNGYKKESKTEQILGCSYNQFKIHLEKQFLKGMNWNNRSEWHIDHIVPISLAKDEESIIKLNHFTNLRPLWARDNIIKSNTRTHLI